MLGEGARASSSAFCRNSSVVRRGAATPKRASMVKRTALVTALANSRARAGIEEGPRGCSGGRVRSPREGTRTVRRRDRQRRHGEEQASARASRAAAARSAGTSHSFRIEIGPRMSRMSVAVSTDAAAGVAVGLMLRVAPGLERSAAARRDGLRRASSSTSTPAPRSIWSRSAQAAPAAAASVAADRAGRACRLDRLASLRRPRRRRARPGGDPSRGSRSRAPRGRDGAPVRSSRGGAARLPSAPSPGPGSPTGRKRDRAPTDHAVHEVERGDDVGAESAPARRRGSRAPPGARGGGPCFAGT